MVLIRITQFVRHTAIACALLLGATVAAPAAAVELPVTGRIGIFSEAGVSAPLDVGLEAEVVLRGTPWGVGGLIWHEYGRFTYGGFALASRSAWLRYGLPVEGLEVLAGANQFQEVRACPGSCEPASEFGALLALSYTFRTERLWLRLTPQYVVPVDGFATDSPFSRSGIPWAEAGVRMTPWLALGLRLHAMPLAVMVTF
jgi:hypothetical protein